MRNEIEYLKPKRGSGFNQQKDEAYKMNQKVSNNSNYPPSEFVQSNIGERFKEELHLNYEELYDLITEAGITAEEVMSDPRTLGFFERELAEKGCIDFNRLAMLVENDPQYFLLSPDHVINDPINVKQQIITCPTKEERISYLLILLAKLRTLTGGTKPIPELYQLKYELLERRLSWECLLREETSDQHSDVKN